MDSNKPNSDNSVIYIKPLNLTGSIEEMNPKTEVLEAKPKEEEKPKVRAYHSPDFGAFFKDRYSLFYGGDRSTCPVCLDRTKLDIYRSLGGIKKVDHLCPTCGTAYPLIRPSVIPKLRFPLR